MAEIYGNNPFLETARDKLVALLNVLVTDMATDFDPALSYVYEKHNKVAIQLNAATVDFYEFTSMTDGSFGSHDSQNLDGYYLQFTIRVHTAYKGGVMDGQKNSRLLNSIWNKLKENYKLDDGYYMNSIDAITPRMTFNESPTIGGQMLVTVMTTATFTQG